MKAAAHKLRNSRMAVITNTFDVPARLYMYDHSRIIRFGRGGFVPLDELVKMARSLPDFS